MAIFVEDLDPVVTPVGDKDTPMGVDRNAPGTTQFSVSAALLAKGEQLAGGGYVRVVSAFSNLDIQRTVTINSIVFCRPRVAYLKRVPRMKMLTRWRPSTIGR